MLGSLFSCSLLLVLLLSSGESQPHEAHEGAPDVGRVDSRGVPLLEAVKTGILDSLGMDRKPRPNQKASREELREMYQLYRQKVREMRGNSSQSSMSSMSSMSTVLLPTTVELIKVVQRGGRPYPHSSQRMRWYRAVFHKNPTIQTELTLTRAELKISRQVLDKPAALELKVRVNRMTPVSSVAWTDMDSPGGAHVSSTQDATLDITPEADRWMRTGGDEAMVVDVGIAVGGKDALETTPTVSLQLDLTEPEPARRTRLPRSNKEDVCDERGYCCRKSVTVSFKDIGWSDWVVAPTEYTMHFCDGTCPHNYKPASMHTQVKSRLHQITKGGSPRPCCVPAAYEPMVLMHYDSRGRLKLTPFDDLIVSKCLCA